MAAPVWIRYALVSCRGLRSLAIGMLTIALPIMLEQEGASTRTIAFLISAGLAGAVGLASSARVFSFSRKRTRLARASFGRDRCRDTPALS